MAHRLAFQIHDLPSLASNDMSVMTMLWQDWAILPFTFNRHLWKHHWIFIKVIRKNVQYYYHHRDITWVSWHLKSMQIDCFFNSLFRPTTKKTLTACHWLQYEKGIHWLGFSSQTESEEWCEWMWKTFPCDHHSILLLWQYIYNNFKSVISEHILPIKFMCVSCETAPRWMMISSIWFM